MYQYPLEHLLLNVLCVLVADQRVGNPVLQHLSGKKVKPGGDDTFFICHSEKIVGMAHGVEGWADVGVDAGKYARELMSQNQ